MQERMLAHLLVRCSVMASIFQVDTSLAVILILMYCLLAIVMLNYATVVYEFGYVKGMIPSWRIYMLSVPRNHKTNNVTRIHNFFTIESLVFCHEKNIGLRELLIASMLGVHIDYFTLIKN